ncbi:MAG TPA: hypothetical protein P5060_00275 [Candidatus Absconditabacterales bacterium]|nr:hypothetical protein [Candidatus Absconditabacterales bacterium]
MKSLDKKDNTNTPDNKANIFKTGALSTLMLFPNMGNAAADVQKDTQPELAELFQDVENTNNDLQNENTINYKESSMLSSGIPPKLKKLLKKMGSIKDTEDLLDMGFTSRDLMFFTNSLSNPEILTTGKGRKAAKNILMHFSGITQEDFDRYYQNYMEKNPNSKISKKDFEVLSQPINAQNFEIRPIIGGHEKTTKTVLNGNWCMVNSVVGTLFMIKPKIENGEIRYESWFLYQDNNDKKPKKIPIRLDKDNNGGYVLEDVYGNKISGHFAVGADGDLYSIDENGKNIIGKNGEKYTVENLDRSKFLFFWDGTVAGGLKTDYDTGEIYLSFDTGSGIEKILADKFNSKKNIIMMRFDGLELKKQGYVLSVNDDTRSMLLSKDGHNSNNSASILDMEYEQIDKWILQSKDLVDQKIEQAEINKIQLAKKEAIFDNFLGELCPAKSGIQVGNEILYPISMDNEKYSILSEFNGVYGIKGRQSLNDGQPAYFILVDMYSGKELSASTQPMFHITEANGVALDLSHKDEYIISTIKKYENTKSFNNFLDIILKDTEAFDIGRESYLDRGVEYKGYYLFPKIEWSSNLREYEIFISNTRRYSTQEKSIKVTKNMTGEDIKLFLDNAINDIEKKNR